MLRLKEVRKEKRMTLDELVEKSGISKRQICIYEANQGDITYGKMKKLAEALDVHILDLTADNYTKVNEVFFISQIHELNEKIEEKETELKKHLELIAIYNKRIKLLEKNLRLGIENEQIEEFNKTFKEEQNELLEKHQYFIKISLDKIYEKVLEIDHKLPKAIDDKSINKS